MEPKWVSFPLAGCDSSDATYPQAAKDIQFPFTFAVNRFMTVLMSCPCLFKAEEESKRLAWPVNV